MSLILHLNRDNLFNIDYSHNIYPIIFSSNVYLTKSNFIFGSKYYTDSKYFSIYHNNIENLNSWNNFLDFYINKKTGYFNNSIYYKNLYFLKFNKINIDLEKINKNIEKILNSNLNKNIGNLSEEEFTTYLLEYYYKTSKKEDEIPFIIIPICRTSEYAVKYSNNLSLWINAFNDLISYFKNNSITGSHVGLMSRLFTGVLTKNDNNIIIDINNTVDFGLYTGEESNESLVEPYITKCLPYYNNILNKYIIFALVTYNNWYIKNNNILILSYLDFDITSYICLKINFKNVLQNNSSSFKYKIENGIIKEFYLNKENLIGLTYLSNFLNYDFMNRDNWELISYYIQPIE